MIQSTTSTLINPQNGNLAFKIFSFENNTAFDHIQRNNYYSLIWVKEGSGKLKADFSDYDFEKNCILSFSPYQPFMISAQGIIRGIALQFHPDFFCIHKHQQEVACNGVLFNSIYKPPITHIDETCSSVLKNLIEQMKAEMQEYALAQYELLISYLKIFLITVSRQKILTQEEFRTDAVSPKEPIILQHLKDSVEKNYRTLHSAGEYAELLNVSPKTLAKIARSHFNKTLTELIAERIIIEAKRELYLSDKTIKEIAYELGYTDEYYFSRFFKANADISPQMYRDTVGFARGIA